MTGRIKPVVLLGTLIAGLGAALAVDAPPKSGRRPTQPISCSCETVDIPGVGKAVALEATRTASPSSTR